MNFTLNLVSDNAKNKNVTNPADKKIAQMKKQLALTRTEISDIITSLKYQYICYIFPYSFLFLTRLGMFVIFYMSRIILFYLHTPLPFLS